MISYIYEKEFTCFKVANAKVEKMYGNKKKRVASYQLMVGSVIKSLGNLLDEKQRKKHKRGLIQRTIIVRRVSSIIKRFYYKSNVFFVNPFEVKKKGNLITKKTLHKQYKSNCHFSNKEAKIDFEIKGVDSVAAEHFVHINGINFYKEKEFDIKIFSPFTKGELHPILFDKNELNEYLNITTELKNSYEHVIKAIKKD